MHLLYSHSLCNSVPKYYRGMFPARTFSFRYLRSNLMSHVLNIFCQGHCHPLSRSSRYFVKQIALIRLVSWRYSDQIGGLSVFLFGWSSPKERPCNLHCKHSVSRSCSRVVIPKTCPKPAAPPTTSPHSECSTLEACLGPGSHSWRRGRYQVLLQPPVGVAETGKDTLFLRFSWLETENNFSIMGSIWSITKLWSVKCGCLEERMCEF